MSFKQKIDSRRRFVFTGAAILSSLAFWKWAPAAAEVPKKIKMLSEDGQLVEVDESVLEAIRKTRRTGESLTCNSNSIISSGDKIKIKLEGIRDFIKRK